MLALAAALATACIGPAKLSLLPPLSMQPPRDPDPTRPLVATPGSAPTGEGTAGTASASVGPVGVGVTGAAVMSWLLGGARPLVGFYGAFDENAAFERQPKRPAKPAPVQ
ncbi:MAG: hypothetical protein H6Q90_1442 [Deltaproteobacteria bacterium]|nr:hypothetical protein [Deltaproteobacteria bacterium]